MKTIVTIPELRKLIDEWQSNELCIALVPTMGNLHAGHLSLVERALLNAERVVVSIFVNPLQFGIGEDYETYPRTLAADCEKLAQLGIHLLWIPTVQDIYPTPIEQTTFVTVPKLSEILCGGSRPTFFKGVTTIVNILFNLIQPQKAFFGQKDYQQLLIIKRMVTDLFMPIEIVSVPTVREADGLAMSSRNNYLTLQERSIASLLYQMLNETKIKIAAGERHFTQLEAQAIQRLTQAGFEPDYFTVRRHSLAIPTADSEDLMILAAAKLGSARLIDNIFCDSSSG